MLLIEHPFNRDIFVVTLDDRTPIGHFQVERFSNNRVSIHTTISPDYRSQGYGREMYDYAERLFGEKGLELVPSPGLSKDSLRIWKARAPEKLLHHKEREDGGAYLVDYKKYF